MAEPAFQAANLVFRYGKQKALDDVSLSVARGERVALLGANGSGKSTLLRVLAGLIFPESGELRFETEVITPDRFAQREWTQRFRRRVGLVFQNPDIQLFCPSVFDEVAFGPLQLGLSPEQVRAAVERALAGMDIAELRYRPPHQLSGGEKKRVALASVLVLDPDTLLLDEPAAALDPRSQRTIVDLLASWRGGSKTVITATHDLNSLDEIADRCIVFDSGRVVASGSPFEILHDTALLQRARLAPMHSHSHGGETSAPHAHPHSELH